MATPTLSIKLHREAFMKVIDPETTLTNEMLRPRREGRIGFPQIRIETGRPQGRPFLLRVKQILTA